MLLSRKGGSFDSWLAMREKLLSLYAKALAADCPHLVQMIQVLFFFLGDEFGCLGQRDIWS